MASKWLHKQKNGLKRNSKIFSKKTLSCLVLSAGISFSGIPLISNSHAYADSNSWDFQDTGSVQTFTAPYTGTYNLQVWGGQGGNGINGGSGGLGGYSSGEVFLTAGQELYVYVGGMGSVGTYNVNSAGYYTNAGGWNGGGNGSGFDGGGGGGATDIRTASDGNWQDDLNSRIIVAGAGGGGYYTFDGGFGGGATGGDGPWIQWTNGINPPPTGGTQTNPGNWGASLGQGGSTYQYDGGGGGGGYFGGGGNTGIVENCAGAGGSGYIGGVSSGVMDSGDQSMPSPLGGIETGQSGNGYARITLIKLDDTTPPVTADNATTGWVNKDVTVNLTATDNSGGSGVAATYYTLDNGSQQTGTSVYVAGEGVHTLTYWSVDNAGNVESQHTSTVKIDKTAPVLNISLDKTTIGQANGKMVPVTATINASDASSGIDSVVLTSITSNEPLQSNDIQNAIYNTPITSSTDSFELRADRLGNGNGRVYTITYTATDKAGNVTTKSVTVLVPHDQSSK